MSLSQIIYFVSGHDIMKPTWRDKTKYFFLVF